MLTMNSATPTSTAKMGLTDVDAWIADECASIGVGSSDCASSNAVLSLKVQSVVIKGCWGFVQQAIGSN